MSPTTGAKPNNASAAQKLPGWSLAKRRRNAYNRLTLDENYLPAAMKTSIVEDGPQRFAASEEYQARRRALWQAIEEKYAPHLAKAGFFRGLVLLGLQHCEFRRELRKITPSPESCWLGDGESRRVAANPDDEPGADLGKATPLESAPTATAGRISTTGESRGLDE